MIEKIYLRFRDSGESGAIYVWDSKQALNAFKETELARTIPEAYQIEGDPHIELADVHLVVQEDQSRTTVSR